MVGTDSYVLEKGNLINEKTQPVIKAYQKRWIILIIYIAYATLSTLQWVEYAIITDVVMKYYGVSASAVNWTSIVFMIMWPTLVFPTSFIIDRMVRNLWYFAYYMLVTVLTKIITLIFCFSNCWFLLYTKKNRNIKETKALTNFQGYLTINMRFW